jgi:hypothetical protein
MSQKPNLQKMTRKELRAYVLANRQDEEAIHLLMDRMHTDPDVFRYRGDANPESIQHLQQLIQQRSAKRLGESEAV